MPHFGGKNSRIGSGVGVNLALIRLRALASSGAASRQYLSVSQQALAVDRVKRPSPQPAERQAEAAELAEQLHSRSSDRTGQNHPLTAKIEECQAKPGIKRDRKKGKSLSISDCFLFICLCAVRVVCSHGSLGIRGHRKLKEADFCETTPSAKFRSRNEEVTHSSQDSAPCSSHRGCRRRLDRLPQRDCIRQYHQPASSAIPGQRLGMVSSPRHRRATLAGHLHPIRRYRHRARDVRGRFDSRLVVPGELRQSEDHGDDHPSGVLLGWHVA